MAQTRIYGSDSQLSPAVEGLLGDVRRRQQEWVDNVEGDIVRAQHEEFTIYGPFGGPAGRQGPGLAEAQAKARSQFQGGTSEVTLVQAIESDDLIVLVLSETCQVRFTGKDSPHPWNLRSTEVYKRDGDAWRRLHRHADPLVRRRSLSKTLALLGNEPSAL